MTNDKPPVAPIEGFYAMLRNGMIARPIIDDHAWLRQGLKQNVDPYLELVWFDDGRCHPSSGLEEFTDEYDIIATISPEIMEAAIAASRVVAGEITEADFEWAENALSDIPIIDTNRLARLEALIPLADAACDYADSHCRWFDISTAPKEIGVEFLASIEIGSTVSAWKEIHILCLDEEGIDSDHDQGWCLDDYSYWAPLPPPPTNPPLPAVFTELGAALEKIKGAG